ncbi:hypothetical protein BG004_007918 [Podila humilis]|nr:hypothetical protein BG004_007918 [Podila humilis]
MISRRVFLALLLISALGVPFAEAKLQKREVLNMENGPLKYVPSVAGNVVFGVVYLLLGAIFSYYCHIHRSKWAICLPVGAIASSLGYFLRIVFDPDNLSLGLFIASNICVVVAPSAFLAFNYMLYGRFITAVDPKFGNGSTATLAEDGTKAVKGSLREPSRFSLIPPLIVGRIFIWSDIITFLVQVTAGSMQGNAGDDNLDLAKLGDKLFLAGVSVQGLSYLLFTMLLTVAFMRLIADRKKKSALALDNNGFLNLGRHTTLLVLGLYLSSLFIILRSVYRVVEYTQGHEGYLITHEVYLFILDAGPLVLAIGIWAFKWPTVIIEGITSETRALESNNPATSNVHHDQSRSDWVPLV